MADEPIEKLNPLARDVVRKFDTRSANPPFITRISRLYGSDITRCQVLVGNNSRDAVIANPEWYLEEGQYIWAQSIRDGTGRYMVIGFVDANNAETTSWFQDGIAPDMTEGSGPIPGTRRPDNALADKHWTAKQSSSPSTHDSDDYPIPHEHWLEPSPFQAVDDLTGDTLDYEGSDRLVKSGLLRDDEHYPQETPDPLIGPLHLGPAYFGGDRIRTTQPLGGDGHGYTINPDRCSIGGEDVEDISTYGVDAGLREAVFILPLGHPTYGGVASGVCNYNSSDKTIVDLGAGALYAEGANTHENFGFSFKACLLGPDPNQGDLIWLGTAAPPGGVPIFILQNSRVGFSPNLDGSAFTWMDFGLGGLLVGTGNIMDKSTWTDVEFSYELSEQDGLPTTNPSKGVTLTVSGLINVAFDTAFGAIRAGTNLGALYMRFGRFNGGISDFKILSDFATGGLFRHYPLNIPLDSASRGQSPPGLEGDIGWYWNNYPNGWNDTLTDLDNPQPETGLVYFVGPTPGGSFYHIPGIKGYPSDGNVHDSLKSSHTHDLTDLDNDDHPQYHNTARAVTWLATKTTDNLTQGTTNKYTTVAEKAAWNAGIVQAGQSTIPTPPSGGGNRRVLVASGVGVQSWEDIGADAGLVTKKDDLSSQANGTAWRFTTVSSFLPGGLRVELNGISLRPGVDFAELITYTGFELDTVTPQTNDSLVAFYKTA